MNKDKEYTVLDTIAQTGGFIIGVLLFFIILGQILYFID